MPINSEKLRAFKITVGGETLTVLGFKDEDGDWVSVDEHVLVFSRNDFGYTGYLNTVGGLLTSATFGPVVAYDSKVTWFVASASNTPDCTVQIVSDGSADTFVWNAATVLYAPGVLVDQGKNISVQSVTGTTDPNTPMAHLGYRWVLEAA